MLFKNISKLIEKRITFSLSTKQAVQAYNSTKKLKNLRPLASGFIRKIHSSYTPLTDNNVKYLEEFKFKMEQHIKDLNDILTKDRTLVNTHSRSQNNFQNILNHLFVQMEKKADLLQLFNLLISNSTLWREFEEILTKCGFETMSNEKANKSISAPGNKLIDVKLFMLLYEQIQFSKGGFELQTFYYNLVESYFDYLIKHDAKLKVLETNLRILTDHYINKLLNSTDTNDFNDISNRIDKTNDLFRKKLPNSIQNVDSYLFTLIIESMFFTKNGHEEAFEMLKKAFDHFLQLEKKSKPFSMKMITCSLIYSILNSNDLLKFEFIINKCVETNNISFPLFQTLKLPNSVNKILFKHFKSNDVNRDINLLFKSWSQIDYVPNTEIIDMLKSFIKSNFEKDYLIHDTFIDSRYFYTLIFYSPIITFIFLWN